MTNYVYIATSLGGYIATSDGGVEWLNEIPNPEHSDFGFSKFISGIDAILMGRKTFEQVLSFGSWPYEKPVFVLSNTVNQLPDATSLLSPLPINVSYLVNSLQHPPPQITPILY